MWVALLICAGVVLLLVLIGGSAVSPHWNSSLGRIAAHWFDLLLCKNTCIPSLVLSAWVNFLVLLESAY